MFMRDGQKESMGNHEEIVVLLDGSPVEIPSERYSLNSIRCYLEMLCLEKQRVLCSLSVDGLRVNLALPSASSGKFARIESESIALDESALLILKTALQQAEHAREAVEAAFTLVLINNHKVARELWWNLARQLKDPILTLSLLPDGACGPANGRASLRQLRKWQLEQIAAIIRDVDAVCSTDDTIQISNILENRVLPWLQKLNELIQLWHETVMAASRLGINTAAL